MNLFMETAAREKMNNDDFKDELREEIPLIINKNLGKVLEDTGLSDMLDKFRTEIEPAFDMAELQAIEFQTRMAMEELRKQFKLLYLVALKDLGHNVTIPSSLSASTLLDDLVDLGYVEITDDGVQISNGAVSKTRDL